MFWKCPLTKFCAWFLSFTALAILHSYVALYSYRWEFLPSEWVLYLWYLVLMVTEIREVFEHRATGIRNKLLVHWNSIWNKFDICLLMFSLFNFILKNFESTFWASALNFILGILHQSLFNFQLLDFSSVEFCLLATRFRCFSNCSDSITLALN